MVLLNKTTQSNLLEPSHLLAWDQAGVDPSKGGELYDIEHDCFSQV